MQRLTRALGRGLGAWAGLRSTLRDTRSTPSLRRHASTTPSSPSPIAPTVLPMPQPLFQLATVETWAGVRNPKIDPNAYLALGLGAFITAGYISYEMGLYDLFFTVSRGYGQTSKPVDRAELNLVQQVPASPSEADAAPVAEETTPETTPVVAAPIERVFPDTVPYLLIGGGTASFAAMKAIRENDAKAKILIVGEESDLPYMRPPLSKELWYSDDRDAASALKFKDWSGKERELYYEPTDFYVAPEDLLSREDGGVAVVVGNAVVDLDVYRKTATLADGRKIGFEKCLIATGGRPRSLPLLAGASDDVLSRITLFRKIAEFRSLDKITDSARAIAIIGGGFLGSELACALAHKASTTGARVIQFFPEEGNMGKIFPKYLSEWTTNKVRDANVDVRTQTIVKNIESAGADGVRVITESGDSILVDHVVVAVGIEPNVELARRAGLEIDRTHGGIVVNAEMEARSGVWAAGDVSCFHDIALGRRRVEHHDHAVVSGRLAGENMTGKRRPYTHQSMFWSDLGPKVGYEAIGVIDSTLPTIGVWARASSKDTPKEATAQGDNIRAAGGDSNASAAVHADTKPGDVQGSATTDGAHATPAPTDAPASTAPDAAHPDEYSKGVVFYMRDKKVVGVLLWNLFNRIPTARKILKSDREYEDVVELAKLLNVHGEH